MPDDNYFSVDGSCLLADIISLKSNSEFAPKKLDLTKYVNTVVNSRETMMLCGGNFYRRFVFYFVNNENRIDDNIIIPDFSQPGSPYDLQLKTCGTKLPVGTRVNNWIASATPPQYILDRLHKSEKAVDTQICCDALELVSRDKLDRLLLYSNDSDFIPLARTLKSLGCNVSLFRLRNHKLNKVLRKEFDSFTVLNDNELSQVFINPDDDSNT